MTLPLVQKRGPRVLYALLASVACIILAWFAFRPMIAHMILDRARARCSCAEAIPDYDIALQIWPSFPEAYFFARRCLCKRESV